MDENSGACPGCGLVTGSGEPGLDDRYRASRACLQIYQGLSALTLSLRDPDFIHQLAVDAYTAQHSGPGLKPIATAFALIGLYLTFERGFTGREVQRAHVRLGNKHLGWPRFTPPEEKAALTVLDAVRRITQTVYEGPIRDWGRSVWQTWKREHNRIARLVGPHL